MLVLPDFPKSRKELSEKLRLALNLRVQSKTPFAAIGRQFTQHEGKAFSYEQILDERKRIIESGFEEMHIPIRFELKYVPALTGEALHNKLDELADDIAKQTSQLGYRVLDQST